MKSLPTVTLTAVLLGTPLFAAVQSQSPDPSTSQNSQDVPHQKPSTNNPDVGKQRQPATTPSTGDSQRQADVPSQKPGTNNPDVAKQRHATPKKNKHTKSTASSTDTDSSTQR